LTKWDFDHHPYQQVLPFVCCNVRTVLDSNDQALNQSCIAVARVVPAKEVGVTSGRINTFKVSQLAAGLDIQRLGRGV